MSPLLRTILVLAIGSSMSLWGCSVPPPPPATNPVVSPDGSGGTATVRYRLDPSIDRFIDVVRAKDFSAHIVGRGSFTIGAVSIDIDADAEMSGDDWLLSLGTGAAPTRSAYIDGRGFMGTKTGWAPASLGETEILAGAGVSLRTSVVLGDAEPDPGRATARQFGILTSFGIFPSDLVDGSIVASSPQMQEFVISVNADGIPLTGHYSLVFDGTRGGETIHVSGSVDYTFDRVGATVLHAPIAVSSEAGPGVTSPPVMAGPVWTTVDAGQGFTVEFPGPPTRTTVDRTDPATGTSGSELLLEFQSSSPQFSASSFSYSEGAPSREVFLTTVRTTDEAAVGGPVIGQVPLLGSRTAAEFIISGSNGLHRSRSILVGSSTITWTVSGSLRDIGSEEADRFLNSLTSPG
jgi:hypothetical protein